MTKKYRCTNIDWDVDDSEDLKDLPTECDIEIEVYEDLVYSKDCLEEQLSDCLSDKFGYCHNGFKYIEI